MSTFDTLFQRAVAVVDDGDIAALERLLAAEPSLVRERLESPGEWLRSQVGEALDGFFERPYLLWFVAEDPTRNGILPPNIADVARTIIAFARRENAPELQEQLDYALSLVCWSPVASKCGVQIDLLDVLLDAGASPDGGPDNALVNDNRAAAEHLLARGAPLTLATAVVLGRLDDAARLAMSAPGSERQMALVLAALRGSDDGLRLLLAAGADVSRPSQDLYAHATPLHHAVWSGSLPAVKVLVDAGADLDVVDTANDATPLGWAEYGATTTTAADKVAQFASIAEYLRAAAEQRGG